MELKKICIDASRKSIWLRCFELLYWFATFGLLDITYRLGKRVENFCRIAWLRGRGEELVFANKRAKLRQLNANCGMGGGGWVIRIEQSLKESSKFYRDKTIILPPLPPLPAVNNDRPLLKQRKLLVNSVSNMTTLWKKNQLLIITRAKSSNLGHWIFWDPVSKQTKFRAITKASYRKPSQTRPRF